MRDAAEQLLEPDLSGSRWTRRPRSSAVVRGAVLAVPLVAGFGVAYAIAGALPRPQGLVATVAWYGVTLAASLATVWLLGRLARRLLPLVSLLRLTLVFPDRAPSRLAVALSASSRSRLDAELERAAGRGEEGNVRLLVTLAAALSGHDRRTRGHCERTRALAEVVGEELGLSSADQDRLRWAALLHDIGKIRVPAHVLNKRGRLTTGEWATLQRHPIEGAALAEPLRPWLGEWVDGVGQHHERFDGRGYPGGLRRDEISLAARIIAVADSFETMTAVRSYNKPKTVTEARRELVRCAGSDFDPAVVRGLLNVSLGRVRWTIGLAAWLAELPILGVPAQVSAEVVTRAAALQPVTKAAVGAALVAAASVTAPVVPAASGVAPPATSAPAAPGLGSSGAPAAAGGGVTPIAATVTAHSLGPAPPTVLAPAPAADATPPSATSNGNANSSRATDEARGPSDEHHGGGDARGRGDGHDPWQRGASEQSAWDRGSREAGRH